MQGGASNLVLDVCRVADRRPARFKDEEKVQGSGFRVQGQGSGFRVRVQGSGLGSSVLWVS